jgi:hypothetical protein
VALEQVALCYQERQVRTAYKDRLARLVA